MVDSASVALAAFYLEHRLSMVKPFDIKKMKDYFVSRGLSILDKAKEKDK